MIAASTSVAVTIRAASATGSIQTRMANCWAPRICASATPSTVAKRGWMTRVRYSVSCCGFIVSLRAARYISAKLKPVPFWMTGSLASEGSWPRTCCTLAITSVSDLSGSALRRMKTETVDSAEGALRGDVVDALGRRHRLGDGRGDEALDDVGGRAGIGGGHRDHRLVDLRILPDRHRGDALRPEEQDHEADDRRQHRPPDEDLGEAHFDASAVVAFPGLTLLSTVT